MNLHIDFDDGGNPFHRNDITAEQLGYEIMHWSRNYELRFTSLEYNTLYATAKEKQQ